MHPLYAEHNLCSSEIWTYSSPDVDLFSCERRKLNHKLSRMKTTSSMSDDDDGSEEGFHGFDESE